MLFFDSLETRRLLAAQGLSTTYFETDHFTGDTVERVEERINFDWNSDEPVEGFGGRFSVRFSSLLEPEQDDTYIFRTRSQGGVRLWIDGELLIDEWTDPGEGFRRSASIDLKGGKVYDLRLDYKEEVGDARIRLLWDTDTTVSATVPNKRLFAYDRNFAVIGDFGEAGQPEEDVAQRVDKMNPDFIVTVGDNNYHFGEASTIDENIGQYYSKYIGNYKGAFGNGASTNKFFPAIGNHDYNADEGYGPYLDYFTLPGNERYYDFVRGPVHFFVLNSDSHEPDGVSETSEQAMWLKEELADSTATWKIVVTHHSSFSSGDDHGSIARAQWPFAEWGADVVLSGHDHLYERVHREGVLYLVNGLGGRQNFDGFVDDPVAGSRKRFNTNYGFLHVSTNELATTFQFLTRTGKVIDSYTLRK